MILYKCKVCSESKPADEFTVQDGYRRHSCKSCVRARHKAYYHANKEEATARNRKAGIGRRGLTEEEYERILLDQDGKCAICRQKCPSGRRLAIDHDHQCCSGNRESCGDCFRGLLCAPCNTGLGGFRDSPDLLAAAAKYLSGYLL